MTWLGHLGAAILIFFGTIFGAHTAASVPTSTSTQAQISIRRSQLMESPSKQSTTTQKSSFNPTSTIPIQNTPKSTPTDVSSGRNLQNLTSDGYYQTDGKSIYMDGYALKNVDPQTFKILYYTSKYSFYAYVEDKSYVWYDSVTPIKGADTSSFRIIFDNDGVPTAYAIDKNAAYYLGKPISNSDPATFTVLLDSRGLGTAWAKDKNAAYMDGQVIPGADPSTFALIPDPQPGGADQYAKDKQNVYFTDFASTTAVSGADPVTFSLIYAVALPDSETHFFGKDKNAIYYDQFSMQGVDQRTFVPIYLNPNDQSQPWLWDGYSKDKNYVYHFENIIPGAKPSTFVPPPITSYM